MAIYVSIRKLREDENSFVYGYATVSGPEGTLELNKLTGESTVLTLAGDDKNGHFYRRAAHKLLKHFREGEFPDTTCYAA